MKYLFSFLLCLSMTICQAAIYQQNDQNGQVIYSDHPLNESAKVLELATPTQGQSSATESVKEPQPAVESVPSAQHFYENFSIISPKNQETIQNQRIIPIEIKVSPDLQEGDSVQLFLDGKPFGAARASVHLTLDQVERGTHQVSAVLIDRDQRVIKQSQTVTIYVHLASQQIHPS